MAKLVASYRRRRLVLSVYITAKDVLPALLYERFCFKSGCVVRVVKCLKKTGS